MRIPLEKQITDIAKIKKIVNTKQNGRVLYITISGSDLYGFASEDSDIDYRGAYLTGTKSLLGINSSRDLIEASPDIVMFEARKEINLALKGNCNVIEHIMSDWIYSSPNALQLRELVRNSFGKAGLYHSYNGMARSNYKKFIQGGRATKKKYLYVFRALMAGIYALETGRIQPNLVELNKYFKIPEVDELIEAKRKGSETDLAETGDLDSLIPPLFKRIDKAYIKSKLPDTPSDEDKEKVNKWLIEKRIDLIQ